MERDKPTAKDSSQASNVPQQPQQQAAYAIDPAAYAAYYAQLYGNSANLAAAYAQQVRSGEGYTYSYQDPSFAVATQPKKAEKPIPSAHAAYASAVSKHKDVSNAPKSNVVHITNITKSGLTKKDVEEVFGRVGLIKIRKKTMEPNVWIGPDGKEASVTYDDTLGAQSAVERFHQQDVFGQGSPVAVNYYIFDEAEEARKAKAKRGGGGGGGYHSSSSSSHSGGHHHHDSDRGSNDRGHSGSSSGGGYRGGGGGGGGGGAGGGRGPSSEGDWVCTSCGNSNFARRDRCNRCQGAKPGTDGGSRSSNSGGGGSNSNSNYGGGGAREGDWTCSSCNSANYARRDRCFKCQTPKGSSGGGGSGGYQKRDRDSDRYGGGGGGSHEKRGRY